MKSAMPHVPRIALSIFVLAGAASDCTSTTGDMPVQSSFPPAEAGGATPAPALTLSSDGGGGGFDPAVATAGCDAGDGASCAAPACPDGGSTTISGTVYDPALANPLYAVTVYVPSSPLPVFAPGAACDSCSSLYPSSVSASAVTDASGHFTLANVTPGTNVPLVVQTGKWRMQYTLATVNACSDNPQPDKSLRLPRNSSEGDLPDIAVSTGGADTLECLPLRMGVDPAEYVAGANASGHIHIFTGFEGASTVPASPASYTALWDSTSDLMKYDVVLLSCEGAETAHMSPANQQSLVNYTSAGGRVFASHFQYSWFDSGPFGGDDLATWTGGAQRVDDQSSVPGTIVTALPNGKPFPEGAALEAWLGTVGALSGGELPIWFARHNADVGATNLPSQPWIALSSSSPAPNATEYFSFDTPVGAASQCGRVVYSDLHVTGGQGSNEPGVAPDYPGSDDGGVAPVVPSGCAMHALTPQEKALEFMMFDLSSCLTPVGQTVVPQTPAPVR